MYHVNDRTTLYTGTPYKGELSGYKRAEASTLKEATEIATNFNMLCPTGWEVYESKSGSLKATCK